MKGTKVSIVAVFFALLLCANVFADDFKAEVLSVTGKVDCMKGSQWTPVKAGDFLLRGDVVQTGFRSELVLKIEGSTVKVSPLTRMSVEMLTAQEDKDNTSLYVSTGSVVSDVNKNNNRKVGFTVRSPVATASVRGTIILVKNTFRSCSFKTLRGTMDVIPNTASGTNNKGESSDSSKNGIMVSKDQAVDVSAAGSINSSLSNASNASSGVGLGTVKESFKEGVSASSGSVSSSAPAVPVSPSPVQASSGSQQSTVDPTGSLTISVNFPE